MRNSLLALLFIGFSMPAVAMAEEETISGEAIFKARCKVCHNALTHQRKIGPGLQGVYGREAESGIGTLTEERLNQWLQNPKALKSNTRMPKYGPMQDPLQRQAVIEYLKTL
jgi:cytochrome c2